MPNLYRFRSLTPKDQALVAIGVLLDGHDAVEVFRADKEKRVALSRVAKDLADMPAELRMPLLGTLLRESLQKIRK